MKKTAQAIEIMSKEQKKVRETRKVPIEERLVLSHLPLVKAIAKKYYSLNKEFVQIGDLISAGNEGLLIALKHFDLGRGVRFGTYAAWWIRNRIGSEIRHSRWIMDIPEHDYRHVLKLLKAVRFLRQEFGHEPTVDDIARRMDIPCFKVRYLLRWTISDILSLDMPVGEKGTSSLADFISEERDLWNITEHEAGRLSSLRDVLASVLQTLTPREKKVVKMRFGLEDGSEHSLQEIGRSFAISRERVRQIEQSAMRKLRQPSSCSQLKLFLTAR